MTVFLALASAYLLVSLWMNLGAVQHGIRKGYNPAKQFIGASKGRRLFATVMLISLMPALGMVFFALATAHSIFGEDDG